MEKTFRNSTKILSWLFAAKAHINTLALGELSFRAALPPREVDDLAYFAADLAENAADVVGDAWALVEKAVKVRGVFGRGTRVASDAWAVTERVRR